MSIHLENLAENPLDKVKVSFVRRLQFGITHIERMTQTNPNGILTPLINNTQLKFDAFAGNLTDKQMSEAVHKAFSASLSRISIEFVKAVSKFEGHVKSVFGKESDEYIMFFPKGLNEFHQANQAKTNMLMIKIIELNVTYGAQLGTAYHDLFVDIQSRYLNAFDFQKKSEGAMANSSQIKELLWDELKKQMYINMLTIVLNNIDNPSIMLTYFKPQLLNYRHKSDDDSETAYILTVSKNSIATADISFSVDDTLILYNSSTVSLFYYGATSPDIEKPITAIELLPDEEKEVTAASLGAPTNKYIIFANDSQSDGEVEITLV